MKNDSATTKEVKKFTLSLVAGWIFGTLFIIIGVGGFMSSATGGTAFILAGLIIAPPVTRVFKEKFNFELSRWLKIILVLILIFYGFGAVINDAPKTHSTTTTTSAAVATTAAQTTTTASAVLSATLSIQDVGMQPLSQLKWINDPSILITNTGSNDIKNLVIDVTLTKNGQVVKKDVGVLFTTSNLDSIRSVSAGSSALGKLNFMSPTDLSGHYTLKVDLRKGADPAIIATDSKDFDI